MSSPPNFIPIEAFGGLISNIPRDKTLTYKKLEPDLSVSQLGLSVFQPGQIEPARPLVRRQAQFWRRRSQQIPQVRDMSGCIVSEPDLHSE